MTIPLKHLDNEPLVGGDHVEIPSRESPPSAAAFSFVSAPTPSMMYLRERGGGGNVRRTKPNRLPLGAPGHVAHGCLLIPVFIAAWWYWTRKACRRMVSRLIRHKPEAELSLSNNRNNDLFRDKFTVFNDSYTRWEDGLDDVPDPSQRLVKWINSGKLHRRAQKQELRNQTRRLLEMNTSNSILLDKTDSTDGDNESIQTNRTSQWECLQDGGNLELCSMRSPIQSDEDGVATQSSSPDNTVFIFDYPDRELQRESSSNSSNKELDKGILT